MPRVTGIHQVAITSTNLERSVAWYRNARSFSTGLSAEHQDGTARFATRVNSEFSVVSSLDVDSDIGGESFPETHTSLVREFLTVEDHSSLEEREHHLPELSVGHSALTHRPLDGQSGPSVVVFATPTMCSMNSSSWYEPETILLNSETRSDR